MALTGKRAKFVQEYLLDKNATQAAIRAGYSAKSAAVEGSRLLKNSEVRELVGMAALTAAEEAGVRAVDVLLELKRIITLDLARAFDKDGNLLPLKDMPVDVRRAIAGLDIEESFVVADVRDDEGNDVGKQRVVASRTKKLKTFDKNKALELLGKHFKLYVDQVEHSGSLTLEQLITQASQKPEGGK